MTQPSNEIFEAIGRAVLNWNRVDSNVSGCLQFLYRLPIATDNADLIHVLDLRKKFDLVRKAVKQGRLAIHDLVLTELKWVNEKLRAGRNIIAHCAWVTDDNGKGYLLSLTTYASVPDDDLEVLLAQSRYASAVTNELIRAMADSQSRPELPSRPRLLPWQQKHA